MDVLSVEAAAACPRSRSRPARRRASQRRQRPSPRRRRASSRPRLRAAMAHGASEPVVVVGTPACVRAGRRPRQVAATRPARPDRRRGVARWSAAASATVVELGSASRRRPTRRRPGRPRRPVLHRPLATAFAARVDALVARRGSSTSGAGASTRSTATPATRCGAAWPRSPPTSPASSRTAAASVRTGQPVEAVSGRPRAGRDARRWRVAGPGWELYAAAVLLTCPVPAGAGAARRRDPGARSTRTCCRACAASRYHRVLAVAALLDRPSAIPPPGGRQLEDGPFSFVADNAAKGLSGRAGRDAARRPRPLRRAAGTTPTTTPSSPTCWNGPGRGWARPGWCAAGSSGGAGPGRSPPGRTAAASWPQGSSSPATRSAGRRWRAPSSAGWRPAGAWPRWSPGATPRHEAGSAARSVRRPRRRPAARRPHGRGRRVRRALDVGPPRRLRPRRTAGARVLDAAVDAGGGDRAGHDRPARAERRQPGAGHDRPDGGDAAGAVRGRLLLGLGAGGGLDTPYAEEQEALGRAVPADPQRRRALREAVATMRRTWTGRLDGVSGFLVPEPPPPVVVGGFGPRMAELAGEVGDGFNTQAGHPRLADLAERARHAHAARMAAEGPGAAPFLMTAFAGLDPRWYRQGSAGWRRAEAAGVDRLILIVSPPYPDGELEAAGPRSESGRRRPAAAQQGQGHRRDDDQGQQRDGEQLAGKGAVPRRRRGRRHPAAPRIDLAEQLGERHRLRPALRRDPHAGALPPERTRPRPRRRSTSRPGRRGRLGAHRRATTRRSSKAIGTGSTSSAGSKPNTRP